MIKKLWNWFKDGFDDGYRNDLVEPTTFKEWAIGFLLGAVGLAVCIFLFNVLVLLEGIVHGKI